MAMHVASHKTTGQPAVVTGLESYEVTYPCGWELKLESLI